MSQSRRPKLSGTFFVTGTHGLTRIATTEDFNKRMSEWRGASPFDLKLVGMITTDETALAVANHFLSYQPYFLQDWQLERVMDFEVMFGDEQQPLPQGLPQ